jgi:hypothetical protein
MNFKSSLFPSGFQIVCNCQLLNPSTHVILISKFVLSSWKHPVNSIHIIYQPFQYKIFSSLLVKLFVFNSMIWAIRRRKEKRVWQACKWCNPWRRTRLLPTCYFLSTCHNVYRHKKKFHLESPKSVAIPAYICIKIILTGIMWKLLILNAHKIVNNCGKYE